MLFGNGDGVLWLDAILTYIFATMVSFTNLRTFLINRQPLDKGTLTNSAQSNSSARLTNFLFRKKCTRCVLYQCHPNI